MPFDPVALEPGSLVGPYASVDGVSALFASCEQSARYLKGRPQMRSWQVQRRKRTRHLIELGGIVVKAGIVELTGDERATIFGVLLWMADRLRCDQGERARSLWVAKGKQAFEADAATHKGADR